MKNIFISFGLNGETESDLKSMISPIKEKFSDKGISAYCNLFDEELSKRSVNFKPEDWMHEAFKKLNKAELQFVLLSSEAKDEGMILEIGYAIAKNIPVIVAVKDSIKDTYLPNMADLVIRWKNIDDLLQQIEKIDFNNIYSKKIKLICFDLDKTLTHQNSWYDLNLALGMTADEDQQLYDEYYAGKIDYKEWIKKILEIFKARGKANLNTITEILSKNSVVEGGKELVEYLQNKGYQVVLISGSIDIAVKQIAQKLGLKMAEATNTFIFDNNNNLQDIVTIDDDKVAKLTILKKFCKELNIDITECSCIGDGDNDIELFKETKHGITFKDSKIKSEAWKTIEKLDDLKNIF